MSFAAGTAEEKASVLDEALVKTEEKLSCWTLLSADGGAPSG